MTPSFSMGSSSQHQTNNPPAWAQPGLQQAGQDALKLYNQGVGFHTYTGPTQAPLSDATLGGLNALLRATGSSAPPVSNSSLQAIMDAMKAKQPAQQAAPMQQPQSPFPTYTDPATGLQYKFDPSTGTFQPVGAGIKIIP